MCLPTCAQEIPRVNHKRDIKVSGAQERVSGLELFVRRLKCLGIIVIEKYAMNKLEIHGRSVQIFAWILGLSDIEYPIGRQRPVISFLYLMFLMGILTYNLKSVIGHIEINISGSTLSEELIRLLFIVGTGISYYILGSVWLFKKDESECLRQLNEVTECIASISSDTDFKDIKRNKMIQIISWITCVYYMAHFFIKYISDSESLSSFSNIFCINYESFLILYINLMFVNYIRIIQLNFAKMNKRLKELTAFTDCSSSISVYEIIKDISRIKQLHIRLTRVSRSFNDFYGIYTLLSITLRFGTMTFHLYNIYCTLYNVQSDSTTHVYTVIQHCLLMSVDLYVVFTVIDACRLTAMEANKTGYRIFELTNNGSSMEIDNEIERFSVQLLQNPLEFTAHGFFVLNRGIIFNIILMLISYLIVLVQLSTCEV
ncbi:Gustatory receptor 17 [Cephus cinctus]|uniref:Gustatory receptor n=1 Tax=Cephus cinctus TaxID=211228 RepID=A0A3L9LT91_CEPCN|nr:gustatory receptor 68a isoform X1 [Cephus cinctus]RLZ02156.1 Gustatory receptor 17 [Cephus cinctus]